jgi:predicted ATPase/transcriptional regulator with XRE-family HTH domain
MDMNTGMGMEPPVFADLLRYHRLAAGLSQEALAERSGLSLQAISLLERGQRHGPRRQTVLALAAALALSPTHVAALEGSSRRRRRPRPAPLPRPPGLPPADSAIVGRETDLAVLPFLLRQPDVRLMTLVGPAGVGKTRLALEAAVLAAPAFVGGVIWVELAAIQHASLVIPTIATQLGLPRDAEPLIGRLATHLQGRDMLLVLDNLEQVLPAGTLLQDLLEECPALRILTTSRIALDLRSERQYAVGPLALPPRGERDPVVVAGHAAVALFLERARVIVPGLALTTTTAGAVAEVCRRLDGLPLALELAAALVRLVPPQAMLARLRDVEPGPSSAGARSEGATLDLLAGGSWNRPDRQQTMRQAITWSYELLTPGEQTVFRGLGVFVGGWNAAAAAKALDIPPEVMVATLDTLCAKHLVRLIDGMDGKPRFGMLETIREYAAERLDALEPEGREVRDRHLDWGLDLAEEADRQLTGPAQGTWLARLDREHNNLRAALGWARDRGDGRGLRVAAALCRFWYVQGYLDEGRSWLAVLLAGNTPAPASTRAIALNGVGNLAVLQGEYVHAAALYEEALALRRMLGDRQGIASSLTNLGVVSDRRGDHERAAALYDEALGLNRELGDRLGEAKVLGNLGSALGHQGNFKREAALYLEALTLFRQLGDTQSIAVALDNLGLVAFRQGDIDRAGSLYEEALALFRDLGDKDGIAGSLTSLGIVAQRQQEFECAAARLRESLRLGRDMGAREQVAEALEAMVLVISALGQPRRAVQLSGAADALRKALGVSMRADLMTAYDQAMQGARATLGEQAYASAWDRGGTLSMAEAVDLCLDPDDAPRSGR